MSYGRHDLAWLLGINELIRALVFVIGCAKAICLHPHGGKLDLLCLSEDAWATVLIKDAQ
jgi:hypothetical protein